ncbi:MAG TPA: 4-hydroxy-3-methylbut-2-enyl diphosphate reductase [Phycisphaerae bacterium]|nr:4-hydroxy-3-methylbut-2-enyl diphosphate reductase [Phycisphaerae bacterium]
MKVLLANPRCYCAGVDRAVQIVELALERFKPPVYVRKEIVHNRYVVERLRGMGAIFVDELSDVPAGALVIFSAHGVAPEVFADARTRDLRVIDATCPLVSKVHHEVLRFVKDGYHIVLIGRRGHEEVEGTMGHSAADITLIENAEQARTRDVPRHERLMVLTQTTLSVDDTRVVMDALRERFPHIQLPPTEDICYATQNRQNAVKEMCNRGIDLLLVVGSQNSSNAARLVETAEVRGVSGQLIDGPGDINPHWLDGVHAVGVTGGASTPDEVVQSVIARLKEFGATDVEVSSTTEENTVFQLPVVLRRGEEPVAWAEAGE